MQLEIAAGFAALAPLGKAVSMFGSARVPPGDPRYEQARRDWLGEALEANGFISPTDTELVVVSDDPEEIAQLVQRCHLRRPDAAHTHLTA